MTRPSALRIFTCQERTFCIFHRSQRCPGSSVFPLSPSSQSKSYGFGGSILNDVSISLGPVSDTGQKPVTVHPSCIHYSFWYFKGRVKGLDAFRLPPPLSSFTQSGSWRWNEFLSLWPELIGHVNISMVFFFFTLNVRKIQTWRKKWLCFHLIGYFFLKIYSCTHNSGNCILKNG